MILFFQGINSLPEKWQNALTSQETTLKKNNVIEMSVVILYIKVAKLFDRPSYLYKTADKRNWTLSIKH